MTKRITYPHQPSPYLPPLPHGLEDELPSNPRWRQQCRGLEYSLDSRDIYVAKATSGEDYMTRKYELMVRG